METLSSPRGLRWGALLLLAALSGMPAHARTHHNEAWARDRFAAAERMREALNGRPSAERSRRDYQRVINSYRNIYFGAPASAKADPSVVAVAETLVEMGRRFNDNKILNSAITQYKFLRREYPGSKYRYDALFTIGEIYKDDLNDDVHARATFEEFLHRYPHNRLADGAHQAIAELDHPPADEDAENVPTKDRNNAKMSSRKSASNKKDQKDKAANDLVAKSADTSADASSSGSSLSVSNLNASKNSSTNMPASVEQASSDSQPNSAARITGIRHWSTPDYTRVAIDVESDVVFSSRRLDDPARIFFDLRGTKLASTLVGKTFDVDDGFLKKIRVAQFQPGRTRVVLEVDNLSDYNAFLIPNPYRLIIDIHGKDHGKNEPGKDVRRKDVQNKDALNKNANVPSSQTDGEAAADDVEAASKVGSKLDAQTAIADLKSEIRAEAGKAPVVDLDVNDDTKITNKSAASNSRHSTSAQGQSGSTKTPLPPIKKVIEADDDDDSPSVTNSTGPRASASRKLANPEIREARPTANGDRSLIRALGLKIGKIVIDPGHGGHDTGTIGPNGLEEKDLVLEVGRRLGKLLETRLGAEVVYTRKDDTFIPLETRTAIANKERADLFISVHANSSHDPNARGVETYYLNFTSSPEALDVAARENAVSEKSIYELQDLVKKIALKEKIEESREFAGDVQESLHSGLAAKSPAIRDRGVKKAPFIVLIGANMPSILAEISFVSNPADEHRLETSEYRQRIAESLYRGIANYVNGLSGVKVASKIEKTIGQ